MMKRQRAEIERAAKRQKSDASSLDSDDVLIFQQAMRYPCDVFVIGNGFKIPVHGIYLAAKSESLRTILTQPANDKGLRTWMLDQSVTKKAAVEFLKVMYDSMTVDFCSLSSQDYDPFFTLIVLHLEDTTQLLDNWFEHKIDQVGYDSTDVTALLFATGDESKYPSLEDSQCLLNLTRSHRKLNLPNEWYFGNYEASAAMFHGIDMDMDDFDQWLRDCSELDALYISQGTQDDFSIKVLFASYIALKNGEDVGQLLLRLCDDNPSLDKIQFYNFMKKFRILRSRCSFDADKVLTLLDKIDDILLDDYIPIVRSDSLEY